MPVPTPVPLPPPDPDPCDSVGGPGGAAIAPGSVSFAAASDIAGMFNCSGGGSFFAICCGGSDVFLRPLEEKRHVDGMRPFDMDREVSRRNVLSHLDRLRSIRHRKLNLGRRDIFAHRVTACNCKRNASQPERIRSGIARCN